MIKDIKGYEGLYYLDVEGNIYSYPKKTRKGTRKLKPVFAGHGYYQVDLCKNKKIKRYLLHRLIAETFLENSENKPQVNHIDGNKLNNKLSNLEWCTRSENQLHSIRIGLRSAKGEKNSQSKLNEKMVIEILNDQRQYKEISNDYNISISTISDIKRGYSWTHITGINNLIKRNG